MGNMTKQKPTDVSLATKALKAFKEAVHQVIEEHKRLGREGSEGPASQLLRKHA